MPYIVNKALDLLSDPESDTKDLVNLLIEDQSLVARLIQVSNSVLYLRGEKAKTVSQTITKLGSKVVRSILLAASTRTLFPMDQTSVGIWGQALWQHSKECGLASRRVAEFIHFSDPEEAFVGGVLHDIGKVFILLNYPEEFGLIKKRQVHDKVLSTNAEVEFLGFDHIKVGLLFMEKWKMPQSLQECVQYHHDLCSLKNFNSLAPIIAYGDYLSHMYGAQADTMPQGENGVDVESIQNHLNLSNESVTALHEAVISDLSQSDFLD